MIPNTESCVTNIMQSNMTGHAPPTLSAWEGARLEISEKSLLEAGCRKFYFESGVILLWGRGSHSFEVKIKTAQYQYNGNMAQVFGTLSFFSSEPFLKQLASHVSTATLQLKFPVMKFFLTHPGHGNIFLEGFKVFCVVLLKDKSSHIKKNRKA